MKGLRGRKLTAWWLIAASIGMPTLSLGQTPFQLDASVETNLREKLGGTPTVDLIRLQNSAIGTPLRFGNVVVGSEKISLDGRALTVSTDYAMDYEVGVVYLKVPTKPGQTLNVSYRYTDKPDPSAPSRMKGMGGMKLNIVPGGLNLLMGLGFAERTGDGKVLTGNAFGFNNSLKFGQATATGVMMFGERSRTNNERGLNMQGDVGGNADGSEGKSRLIMQNIGSKALGGTVNLDYQDVSKNFAAFSNLSGVDDAKVNQLRNERGITRLGVSADRLKLGGLGVSSGFRSVSDDQGSIDWRNYGVTSGGFSLNFNSQKVSKNFNRFKDIAEGDRQQLERERGLARENWAGAFVSKTSKLNFSSVKIGDASGQPGISRTDLGFDGGSYKFSYGQQEVAAGFNRFQSLLGDEQARYGLDAGLKRQWLGLQTGVLGKGTSLDFNTNTLTDNNTKLRSSDVKVAGKTWSIQNSSRAVDNGFTRFNALNRGDTNGRAEVDNHVSAIAAMYGPGTNIRPEDRNQFSLSGGLERNYTQISAKPFAGWDLSFSDLSLRGRADGAHVQTVTGGSKNTNFTLRRQELGRQFNEFSNLMSFERWKLGNVAGMDRTDFGLAMDLGRGRNFTLDSARGTASAGSFSRTGIAYRDKKLDIAVNSREVDSGLAGLNQLADNERDVLNGLQGYKQRDAKIKWQILPNLNLDATIYEAVNDSTNVKNRLGNYAVDWSPNTKTKLNYVRNEQKSNDPLSVLFANLTERITLSRDLGRLGQILFQDEKINFDGTQTNQVDSHRQYLALQTSLTKGTDVRTEQTRTSYGNGNDEKVSSNTVSTAITKNLGVSVTDTDVDRTGQDRDEKHRNYGFWVDLGKGVRVSYGYARQLVGAEAGTLNSSFAVGQNAQSANSNQTGGIQQSELGGLKVGGAYGVNQWDQNGRTQAFTNVAISSAAPFRVGFLTDVKFHMGMDTASDYSKFAKENKLFQFAGKLGSNQLGYEYMSQMHPSGARGIDRTFKLESDASDKRWIRVNMFYKYRTLPWDQQIAIRNFNIITRPTKNMEVVNRLETNPEQMRGDVFLGSLPVAARTNSWEVNYKRAQNMTVGGFWKELVNDQNNARSRTGGMSLTLFENSGSPVKISYGLEQSSGAIKMNSQQRYSLQFDQRPGPNQSFSFLVGNVSYEQEIANGVARNNFTLRVNYQLRF